MERSLPFPRKRPTSQRPGGLFPLLAGIGHWTHWLVLTCLVVLNSAETKAQTVKPGETNTETVTQDQELKNAIEKMRAALKETSLLRGKYYFGRKDDSDEWAEKYTKAFKAGQKTKKELFQVAFPILIAKSELNKEQLDLATMMMFGSFDDSQYEMSFQLAELLEKLSPSPESKVMKLRSSYVTNRFKTTQELTPQIASLPSIPEDELETFKSISRMVELQTAEEKIRAAEMLTDDLPRVELDTAEGKIVLELYENQYPDTVGHFISLVEKDFYKGTPFHKVIKNFMPFTVAQTGLLFFEKNPANGQMGWRARIVDYRIPSEAPVDGNHRAHFRGTVCFVLANDAKGKPVLDTAGAEFFIALAPLPLLESTYIPFGRVISDMTIVDRLQENYTISKKDFKEAPLPDAEASFLISARVIRKRDHVYEPRKVK